MLSGVHYTNCSAWSAFPSIKTAWAEAWRERFDDLPVETTAPGVRVLVLSGLMFRQAAVYAVEMPDGIIYLIGLEVDHY